MIIPFLMVFSFLFTAVLSSIQCETSTDCGLKYYCFKSYCEQCIPCEEVFHRQPPTHRHTGQILCARSEDQCGSCLPGYQAAELTGQRHSMLCYKAQVEDQIIEPTINNFLIYIIPTLIVAILIVFAVFFFLFVTGCPNKFVLKLEARNNINNGPTISSTNGEREPIPGMPPFPPSYDEIYPVVTTDVERVSFLNESQTNQAASLDYDHQSRLVIENEVIATDYRRKTSVAEISDNCDDEPEATATAVESECEMTDETGETNDEFRHHHHHSSVGA